MNTTTGAHADPRGIKVGQNNFVRLRGSRSNVATIIRLVENEACSAPFSRHTTHGTSGHHTYPRAAKLFAQAKSPRELDALHFRRTCLSAHIPSCCRLLLQRRGYIYARETGARGPLKLPLHRGRLYTRAHRASGAFVCFRACSDRAWRERCTLQSADQATRGDRDL